MSAETKVMSSVSTVITFIKEQVRIDMQRASQRGDINIDKNDLEKVCNVIESSIQASYSKSLGEVVAIAKSLKGWIQLPGIKHLIECHCVLAIYKKNQKIINHKFPVYSKIDEKGAVIPKLSKCNNCDTSVRNFCFAI